MWHALFCPCDEFTRVLTAALVCLDRLIVLLSIDGVSDDGEAAVHVEVSCNETSFARDYAMQPQAVSYTRKQSHFT